MYCKNCAAPLTPGSAFCNACGAPGGAGDKHCANCAYPKDPNEAVCSHCGTAFESAPQTQPTYAPPAAGQYTQSPVGGAPKSKMTAGLLGIFLGGFGVHRFYLGYTMMGVIQIVATLVTCGIASLWGLVEGIMILCGSAITTDSSGMPLGE